MCQTLALHKTPLLSQLSLSWSNRCQSQSRCHKTGPWTSIIIFLRFPDNFRWGSWFDHVMAAWKLRDEENMHFVFYEDMQKVCLVQCADNDRETAFCMYYLNIQEWKTTFRGVIIRDNYVTVLWTENSHLNNGGIHVVTAWDANYNYKWIKYVEDKTKWTWYSLQK